MFKLFKKIVAVILTVITLISVVPMIEVSAATTYTPGWVGSGIYACKTSTVAEDGEEHLMLKVNDKWAYCIQPGHSYNSGTEIVKNDARCISGYPKANPSEKRYLIKPVRHHNRQIHKNTILKGGVRKFNQAPTYVKGFRQFDKVRYEGQECFVWGRRATGSFLLRTLDGTLVKDGANYKKLTLLERSRSYLII